MAHPVEDIIVVVPGIMGSVLTRNGRTVWAPQAGAAMRAFLSLGGSIRDLQLEGDDPTLDELGDGVVATGLVQDLHVLPGRWKIDGYTGLRNALFGSLPLKKGENYFECAYDWRRDNRVAAKLLKSRVDGWLHVRRKDYPNAKVILLAHSMGGIVSRLYLEMLDGWRDTRRLVTFGTPYSGSINALASVVDGFHIGKWKLQLDLSAVLWSFTSLYQLLPSYKCVQIEGRDDWLALDADGVDVPNMETARLADALSMQRALRETVDANRKHGYENTGGYDIRPLVGDWQKTDVAMHISNKKVTFLPDRGGSNRGGDGTVPAVSAVPHELQETKNNVFYVDELHGSLQNSRISTDNLVSLVIQTVAGPPIFHDRQIDARLSVEVDDALVGDPVTVRATTSVSNPELNCEIHRTGGPAPVKLPMTIDQSLPNSAFLTLERPDPGDYRAIVSGPGIRIVTGLFSVVDPDD